jgi:hypothetical protein
MTKGDIETYFEDGQWKKRVQGSAPDPGHARRIGGGDRAGLVTRPNRAGRGPLRMGSAPSGGSRPSLRNSARLG